MLSRQHAAAAVADLRDFTRKVKPVVIDTIPNSIASWLPLQAAGSGISSIPQLIAHATPFSKGVLLLLVGMSVYSWAVLWDRLRLFGRVREQDARFLQAFRGLDAAGDLRMAAHQHPVSVLARSALAGIKATEQHTAQGVPAASRFELVQRAMDRAADEATNHLERHVGFLATTGSVAPFIGLLGTVWGVMISFVNIGAQGSATLVVVAPGIAEALIATIAGLAAAIPSVIGYNHCLGKLREISHTAAQFTSEFMDRRLGARPS
jgi:biopolymer transport protein TolQ